MKKTRYNEKIKYVILRISQDSKITHDYLEDKFNYSSEYVTDYISPGFNARNLELLISDIINNSTFNLISVSEDNNSISYHFVGTIEE